MSREYRISCIVPDTPAGAQLIKACKDLVEQANEELRRSNATVSFRINGIYGDPPACEPKSIEDGCDIGIAYGDSLSSWVNENISRKSFLLMSAAEIEGMNDIHLKAYPSATTMGRHLAELTRRCIKKYKTKNPCALFENSMAGSLCCESFLSSASDFAVRQKNVFTYEKDDEYFGDYVASLINTGFRVFCVYGFETSGKGYKSLLNSLVEWREKDKTIKILTDVNLPDKILIPDKIFNGAECVDALVCGSSGNSNRYCVGVKFFEMLMEALVELIVKSAMWSFDDGNTDICLKNEIRENFNYISTKIGTFSFVNNALCVPFYYHFLKTPLVNPEFFRSDGDSRDSIYIATARVESLTNKISQDGLSEFDETCIDAKDRFIKEILKKCFSVVKAWFIDDDFDFIDDKLKFKKSLALIKGNSIIQVPYNTKYDLSSTNVLQFYWRNDSVEREVLSVDGVEQLKKLNKFQIGVTRDNLNSADGDCRIFSVEESARFVEEFSELKLKLNEVQNGRYLYYIPYVRTSATRAVNNVSGIILVASVKYRDVELAALKNLEERFFGAIFAVDNQLRINRESVKSAIGSIMSRNGSHNIGSHVLATLSHNIGTMPDDRVLYQYIQHRMDYIATATTDFPTWASEEKLVNGLMRRFLSQRHLLDYIASSEGLHAFKFQDPNISEDAEQPNTIRLRIRKLDEKGPPREFIKYPRVDATANFDEDVAVAIPGGVIGGHAFFTIIENVIRNAAKHGWAKISDEQKKCLKKNQEDHLDIFVDFKRSDSNRTIEIDVYDGLSDVFAIAKNAIVPKNGKELTPEEDATNKAIKNLRAEINEWKEHARDPLSTRKQNENGKTEEELLADYLSGKSDTLPKLYDPIKTFLGGEEKVEGSDKPFKRCKLLSDILTGATDKDDELGHRLWLPLHHGQQLKLAKQFIDESGALRKENWGLAEMKISAGYLNRRPISEIGGLDKADPIITPMCEAGADGGAHLGYHFSIPVPREIAFVCDTKDIDSNKITELRSYGIYVVDPPKGDQYLKPKNKDDEDWNYSYVVLPKFPEQKDPHLPFRILAKDNSTRSDMVPQADFYEVVLDKLKKGNSTVEDIADTLKKMVYRAWIRYWSRKRYGEECDIPPELFILPSESPENSGQGLISNAEIWSFVFKELFRSTVYNLIKNAGRPTEDGHWYLILLTVVDKYRDGIGKFLPDATEANGDIIRKINDDKIRNDDIERELIFKMFIQWFALVKTVDRETLVKAIKKFGEDHKVNWFEKRFENLTETEIRRKIEKADAFNKTIVNAIDNRVFGVTKGSVLSKITLGLRSAYREADIMLRKYEERIISLPKMWQDGSGSNGSCQTSINRESTPKKEVINRELLKGENDIGISLVYNDKNAEMGQSNIVFGRHFKTSNFDSATMAYMESLSGTQSYLHDLLTLPTLEYGRALITKMYESGLSRILIMDERVSKFLRDRPEEIRQFCQMGIWCIDETKLNETSSNAQEAITKRDALIVLNQERIREFLFSDDAISPSDSEKFFDVFIIHQGLIDKILPKAGTGSKDVEKFINRLKAFVPYVLITTGRGTPANVPDSARILPFSVLENALFKKHPEKLVLLDTIMNILPIGEH